ncbi:hypothetical protein [Paenibacillus sp. FSL L8-0463]|uniref:hypothetical protein n=1 Tax=Paenibacillus sp. FSL L8-0463 TaxID=2954687 RepID=UPI0031192A92
MMTPEQIEKIKLRITDKQARLGYLEPAEVELMDALDALEEAQQTELYKSHEQLREQNARLLVNNHNLQRELEVAQEQDVFMRGIAENIASELKKRDQQLAEAQQQLTLERERTDYWGNKEEEARWEAAKWREDLVKAPKNLAEAQRQLSEKTGELVEAQLLINEYRIAVGNCYSVMSRRRKEVWEAQQTIARQGEIIHGIDRDLTKLRMALVSIANDKAGEVSVWSMMLANKARAALEEGETQP